MPPFDPAQLNGRDTYFLMIGTVVPRPIAFVTTLNEDGSVNLAPFSYFNGVCNRPPLISICIGHRKFDGQIVKKDTLRNIEATGECVVHIPPEHLARAVNGSSAEFPPGESELDALGLQTVASDLVGPPRLIDCPVAMECKLERVVMLGSPRPSVGMVIAEIVRWHIADDVWDAQSGSVDVEKLKPLSRLGGSSYGTTRAPFSLPRPDWTAKGVAPPSRRK